MDKELKALKMLGTWFLVLLMSKQLVTSGLLYKLHSDGTLDYYNARLVVLGNKQEYRVNYEGTFALVAKMTTLRTILSIVVS